MGFRGGKIGVPDGNLWSVTKSFGVTNWDMEVFDKNLGVPNINLGVSVENGFENLSVLYENGRVSEKKRYP